MKQMNNNPQGFENISKNDFIKYEFELDEIIYQKIPTFRVHLKDNQAVGEWHRDRDYNHGKSEINIWLPFTDAYDTNTIWIESEEDKNDFKPYNVSYGEVLVFNGANLIHGNKTAGHGKSDMSAPNHNKIEDKKIQRLQSLTIEVEL